MDCPELVYKIERRSAYFKAFFSYLPNYTTKTGFVSFKSELSLITKYEYIVKASAD